MTATDKNLLENALLLGQAESLKKAGFLGAGQFSAIRAQLPVPKSNDNLLVRFGFFLLGCFLLSSVLGVFSLFGMAAFENHYKAILFFYAAITLVITEVSAKMQYHGFGLDDAFILGFQMLFFVAVGVTFENAVSVFTAMAILGLLCSIRYVHVISMLVALIGITGFLATLTLDYAILDKMFLPFVMLALAVSMYWTGLRLKNIPALILYRSPMALVRVFSLVLGYASVNYLVVREMSVMLMGLSIQPGGDIPMAGLFYAFTFAIPAAYIFYALREKDRMLLTLGVVALGFSIFSIRYYYSILPAEIALLLGGAVLAGIVWFCISRLRHKQTGLTFEPDHTEDFISLNYAQALIINSHPGLKTPAHQDSPMDFGGGGYSGGGSEGSF